MTAPDLARPSGWDPYAIPAARPAPADCPDPQRWEEQEHRRATIAALRALATFLEDNPGVPAPDGVDAVRWAFGTREERLAHVQDVAGQLGSAPDIDDEFASVSRRFGPVLYRVFSRLPGAVPSSVTPAETAGALLES